MDPDYVAKVLSCDFADLGPKGLRAAAIAVRSAAYWQMAADDEVCTSDLLFCPDYSCDGTPSEKFREAATETRGQYLSFDDVVTYGFYVPGEELGEEHAETCEHPDEDSRVTINDGKKGDKVEQSTIGKVAEEDDDNYGQNRGAMSVEVIACLEAKDTSPPRHSAVLLRRRHRDLPGAGRSRLRRGRGLRRPLQVHRQARQHRRRAGLDRLRRPRDRRRQGRRRWRGHCTRPVR